MLPCAAENERLSEEVSALRQEAGADEAEALRDDVALLRTELVRLSDEVKRLQSAPRVRPSCPCLACHAMCAIVQVLLWAIAEAQASLQRQPQRSPSQLKLWRPFQCRCRQLL